MSELPRDAARVDWAKSPRPIEEFKYFAVQDGAWDWEDANAPAMIFAATSPEEAVLQFAERINDLDGADVKVAEISTRWFAMFSRPEQGAEFQIDGDITDLFNKRPSTETE